mgnify:CR=1 FL=1
MSRTKSAIGGGLIGLSILLMWPAIEEAYSIFKRSIPKIEHVQDGYIAPSRIGRVGFSDLDKNGEPETRVIIDDKSYLLREVDGKPVLSGYRVSEDSRIEHLD